MTASSPRPAAPDTTGGDLRAIAHDLYGLLGSSLTTRVLALPALRDLLAERDTLAAQVRAVEGLAEELQAEALERHDLGVRYEQRGLWAGAAVCDGTKWVSKDAADRIRRALGTPTTGGGE